MSPHNMSTFLLAFAGIAIAGKIQHRQVDCSTTKTLDTITVTRVEPISIYILPGQQPAPTETGSDKIFTAVYTTVYPTFYPECSRGLRPQTYTITQTCRGSITSCHGYGDELPPGFTTTQTTCTEGPTPLAAVLTVPQQTDDVVTTTIQQVVTGPGLTSTRLVTKTCLDGPCLPDITAAAIPGNVTLDDGYVGSATTVTKTETDRATATQKETATVTVDPEFQPGNLNSGAGHILSSDKLLTFVFSSFALIFLMST
ncbi:uncharacterized protein CTRU02_206707 [Colletotrichum truncatum]|uniref:Uncharacterized protein n=1 Tax=Colletotrichum truncatum TaxID=5467 RepID=A0ACC3Z7M1_COLTU|nr:uncharacterized protein CTRU02_14129 [Colletotrichum truncatum]KAF6782482.1 hypothetical protein CTRU02_14129 [Colletotrichum truncatum]